MSFYLRNWELTRVCAPDDLIVVIEESLVQDVDGGAGLPAQHKLPAVQLLTHFTQRTRNHG